MEITVYGLRFTEKQNGLGRNLSAIRFTVYGKAKARVPGLGVGAESVRDKVTELVYQLGSFAVGYRSHTSQSPLLERTPIRDIPNRDSLNPGL